MRKVTVMVTCASAGPAVSVIKALRRQTDLDLTVIGVDDFPTAVGLYLCHRAHLVPVVDSSRFIPIVEALCRAEGVDAIIPGFDADTAVLAEHAGGFARLGAQVLASPPAVVRTANDKLLAHRHCLEHGIRAPDLYTPAAVRAGEAPLPVVLKPRRGVASRGVQVIHAAADLPRDLSADWLVQAYVPGNEEYTIDTLSDPSGVPLAAIPRRRIQVRAGQTVTGRTVRDPELSAFARRVVGSFGITGGACVQCKRWRGELYFIELNPRYATGLSLSVAAGANLPVADLKLRLGLSLRADELQYRGGVTMLRYWEEAFVTPDQMKQPFRPGGDSDGVRLS